MTTSRLLLGSSLVLLSACMLRDPAPDAVEGAPVASRRAAESGQAPDGEDSKDVSDAPEDLAVTNDSVGKPVETASGGQLGDLGTLIVAKSAGEGTMDGVGGGIRPAMKSVSNSKGVAREDVSHRPMETRTQAEPMLLGLIGAPASPAPARTLRQRPAAGPVRATGAVAPADLTTYGSSEHYTDYGVNPFTMVAKDALSTFSIDVDTASYSLARKKLDAGVLPPIESVRVEEFVNYLDYGYEAPTDGSPFAVDMAAMPDPFREGHHVLRVGVQGKQVSRDERPPLHLTFLVDVSGSMSSADKLGLAKESLHMLVDNLREDDTVGLCTYAGRVAKILEPTSAANKRQIHDAIEGLKSGGSTAMSSGIDLAYGMAWASFESGEENRVVVLSDGDANVGRTSWDDMLSQVKGYADKGVTLSTIGFGMGNYQDTLMEQLSDKGDGNNYYIDDSQQAHRVFVDELGGTLVTIARDVKIQVEFNPDSVLAYRLIGYENRDIADKDFRDDKVDAGEVGAGHNVTALYSILLKDGYARDLATVRLRWEQPGADVDQGGSAATERSFRFSDKALAERTDLAAKDLRIAYATATFAEVLRQSPEVEELSMDQLIAFARHARRVGEKDDIELVGLMEKARDLGAGTSSGSVSTR